MAMRNTVYLLLSKSHQFYKGQAMNPYKNLPAQNFWKAVVQSENAQAVQFDCGQKFTFSAADSFVTAGSCFAQHFAKKLTERGGNVLIAEQRHPLIPESSDHGYNLFS